MTVLTVGLALVNWLVVAAGRVADRRVRSWPGCGRKPRWAKRRRPAWLSGRTNLPVGAMDTRASGWWAMIFTVFTEASLFAYLLFSYYYLAVQPHAPGTFPEGGAAAAGAGAAQHRHPAGIVGRGGLGAIRHRARQANGGWCAGWASARCSGVIFLVIQCFEWADRPFGLSSTPYSSLYFVITGFHMAHVVVGVLMLLALTFWSGQGYFNSRRFAHIHIGALYWHFVDAVWIAVFFTFYITPLLGLTS